jgi:hypothetical protein
MAVPDNVLPAAFKAWAEGIEDDIATALAGDGEPGGGGGGASDEALAVAATVGPQDTMVGTFTEAAFTLPSWASEPDPSDMAHITETATSAEFAVVLAPGVYAISCEFTVVWSSAYDATGTAVDVMLDRYTVGWGDWGDGWQGTDSMRMGSSLVGEIGPGYVEGSASGARTLVLQREPAFLYTYWRCPGLSVGPADSVKVKLLVEKIG